MYLILPFQAYFKSNSCSFCDCSKAMSIFPFVYFKEHWHSVVLCTLGVDSKLIMSVHALPIQTWQLQRTRTHQESVFIRVWTWIHPQRLSVMFWSRFKRSCQWTLSCTSQHFIYLLFLQALMPFSLLCILYLISLPHSSRYYFST